MKEADQRAWTVLGASLWLPGPTLGPYRPLVPSKPFESEVYPCYCQPFCAKTVVYLFQNCVRVRGEAKRQSRSTQRLVTTLWKASCTCSESYLQFRTRHWYGTRQGVSSTVWTSAHCTTFSLLVCRITTGDTFPSPVKSFHAPQPGF